MSYFLPNFRIIVCTQKKLPLLESFDFIERCSTEDELLLKLAENTESVRILACSQEIFLNLPKESIPPNLETIYCISDLSNTIDSFEIIEKNAQITKVSNENDLVLNLLFKVILAYYSQSQKYQKDAEQSVANSCILIALETINQIKTNRDAFCPSL
ncbi:unnamed protein product [Adineta ricciae]|uniref:Uncharacterized protein n=1 Tax=Adineta ricciae TaxID=249248 RepID=A0A815BG21_ADIRI|nr:unnamed protein product [Adineta ricciae]CAF1549413.1 unnamed protein product [Adineta ricciae]